MFHANRVSAKGLMIVLPVICVGKYGLRVMPVFDTWRSSLALLVEETEDRASEQGVQKE